ncbi:uncharacterized protein FSUBG_11090 [Fusarium subglutinans]|uniref:Uncharacterized protein n=1 Tax=Gibberella subglutinans TaxID=42677 RepID=A0A8H5LAZ5_GIBSU|nr:uncharacterized protein FSUBG_11090 [Fusarium subglutinans]KAF5589665.1 hypothetical protein FSUBG_11090 [Fusarium subglutinans]
MVAWLKSRAEAREKERRALVAQVAELDKNIQKDIDDAAVSVYPIEKRCGCQSWQLKADKLAAKEAESTIGDAFEQDGLCAAALVRSFLYSTQKKIELTDLKHKETAEEERRQCGERRKASDACSQVCNAIRSRVHSNDAWGEGSQGRGGVPRPSPYVSDIPAVFRLVANTQFAQRVQSPPFPLKPFSNKPINTLCTGSLIVLPDGSQETESAVQQRASGTEDHLGVLGHQISKRCTYRTTPSSTEHIKILEGTSF